MVSSSHEIGSFQAENYPTKHTLPHQLNNKYNISYVIPETSD